MIDLPGLMESKGIDNMARIINRYLQDVTLPQKFLIRIKIDGDEEDV